MAVTFKLIHDLVQLKKIEDSFRPEADIILKGNRLTTIVKTMKGAAYAFYLQDKNGVEKHYYTKNNKITFDATISDGLYKIFFFIKDSSQSLFKFKREIIISNSEIFYPECLQENDSYKINYYKNKNSDITFIVFNQAGTKKETSGFGLDYLFSKGFNVITCAQNNNQYQGLSYETFEKILKPIVDTKRVFLYGSSLGGYCALYYAGAVNGTVIAAAPKNSAHPTLISERKSKFKKEDFKHKDIIDNPLTMMPVYIFVDPYVKADMFFINEFIKPAYPECNVLEFPHAGHEVLYHINKLKKLSPIITTIVAGEDVDISNAEYWEDTDFTRYGKALHAYREAVKYIKEIESSKSIHPVVAKKLQWLNRKIK